MYDIFRPIDTQLRFNIGSSLISFSCKFEPKETINATRESKARDIQHSKLSEKNFHFLYKEKFSAWDKYTR